MILAESPFTFAPRTTLTSLLLSFSSSSFRIGQLFPVISILIVANYAKILTLNLPSPHEEKGSAISNHRIRHLLLEKM